MTKVISFLALHENLVAQSMTYPELDALLNDGWELMDTLPVTSNGASYLLTVVLSKPDKKKKSR